MAATMLKPQVAAPNGYWGLGLKVGNEGQSRWFEHGGLTDGYISEMIGFVNVGNGVIVLTNSESSFPLILEIVRGVATTYDWPAWKPKTLKP
jgi:hypothetical protein